MVVADRYWLAELSREQLLDLLIGARLNVRRTSIDDAISKLSLRKGRLKAIWKADAASNISPLPQVIVGERSALEDLMAWSATYLHGLGPLTAQTRLLVPDEYQTAVQLRTNASWWQLAGTAVGMVIGEVLMNARRAASPSEVSVLAARSTLSFVLMRAAALGLPTQEFGELSERWEWVRQQTGQLPTSVSARTICKICEIVADTVRNKKGKLSQSDPKRLCLELLASQESPANIISAISNSIGLSSYSNRLFEEHTLTAEEKIRVFDDISIQIINDSGTDAFDKSFSAALVAAWCQQGFTAQIALLGPHFAKLPELALWVGAMQLAVRLPEALTVGEGLGWRLAREFAYDADIFSPPRSDFAVSELQLLMRGKNLLKNVKLSERSRFNVEIFPCISTIVRNFDFADSRYSDLQLQPSLFDRREGLSSDLDRLGAVEQSLERALRLIRENRSGSSKSRQVSRKRRN